ncbi:hypothetical protein CDAR_557711 [Caerostris darwini]|uniref:Uncharacterized protein n=1 Tax=Caerostris darwini TaxID=1538125 RepID=A0AAV4W2W7_9ARAC|nr:hypothetical protein CDAR_557711 [Caerostris darwini]
MLFMPVKNIEMCILPPTFLQTSTYKPPEEVPRSAEGFTSSLLPDPSLRGQPSLKQSIRRQRVHLRSPKLHSPQHISRKTKEQHTKKERKKNPFIMRQPCH